MHKSLGTGFMAVADGWFMVGFLKSLDRSVPFRI